jgi:hypothetical protein
MERVLVCGLVSTRAHKLTFPSFKRQVLDELDADLALALAIDENYDYGNPFWQHARYRWTSPTFREDYGKAYDLAQRWLCAQYNVTPPDWRAMLRVRGYWQGGIRSAEPEPTASAILPFCRWLLLRGLQEDRIIDRYDRFVITRPDFIWLCPHPPLPILDSNAIWVPEGEDHGGLNDRHLVASRADIERCLDGIKDVLLYPGELYDEIKDQSGYVNDERLLAHHLKREGLLQKVKRFPSVMYTAREVDDESPTWSKGYYEGSVGHYIKYEKEFHAACAYSTVIRSSADWEGANWKRFETSSLNKLPVPLFRRLRYASEGAYYKMLSGFRRPGRIQRGVNVCKWILRVAAQKAEEVAGSFVKKST